MHQPTLVYHLKLNKYVRKKTNCKYTSGQDDFVNTFGFGTGEFHSCPHAGSNGGDNWITQSHEDVHKLFSLSSKRKWELQSTGRIRITQRQLSETHLYVPDDRTKMKKRGHHHRVWNKKTIRCVSHRELLVWFFSFFRLYRVSGGSWIANMQLEAEKAIQLHGRGSLYQTTDDANVGFQPTLERSSGQKSK